MSNFAQFLTMGGYAIYVWPAYGVCLVVLLANVWLPIRRRRQFIRRLNRKQQRQ